jgi:hypothetical protein
MKESIDIPKLYVFIICLELFLSKENSNLYLKITVAMQVRHNIIVEGQCKK